jgi:hypothetical protein
MFSIALSDSDDFYSAAAQNSPRAAFVEGAKQAGNTNPRHAGN